MAIGEICIATNGGPRDKCHRSLLFTQTQQFRMHPEILQWSNDTFYSGRMLPLQNPPTNNAMLPYTVITIVNREVEFLEKLLRFCQKLAKATTWSYGIICGNATSKIDFEKMIKQNLTQQLFFLLLKLFSFCFAILRAHSVLHLRDIEVGQSDTFHGREKDVIVISALQPADGFTAFPTETNLLIALSRANHALVFCGAFGQMTTKHPLHNTLQAMVSNAAERKRLFSISQSSDVEYVIA